MNYELDWSRVVPWIPLMTTGFLTTIALCVAGVIITMVVALPLALLRMSRIRPLSLAANLLISVSRAVPLYIFLLWLFYGLPLFVEVNMTPLVAGLITLVVQFSSFQAEAYRSGLMVVTKGQREAALAVGLNRFQTFVDVVLPQAMRVAVPPTLNNLISMFKATSVFAVIGVVEITRIVQGLVGITGRPLEFFTVLTMAYVAGVGVMTLALVWYERATQLPHERAQRAEAGFRLPRLWRRRTAEVPQPINVQGGVPSS